MEAERSEGSGETVITQSGIAFGGGELNNARLIENQTPIVSASYALHQCCAVEGPGWMYKWPCKWMGVSMGRQSCICVCMCVYIYLTYVEYLEVRVLESGLGRLKLVMRSRCSEIAGVGPTLAVWGGLGRHNSKAGSWISLGEVCERFQPWKFGLR
jgi:hypothetical protein